MSNCKFKKMYEDNYNELEKAITLGEEALKANNIDKKFVDFFAKDFDEYNAKLKAQFVFKRDSVTLLEKDKGYRIPITVLAQTKGAHKFLCIKQMQEFMILINTLVDNFKKRNNMC